MDWESASLSLFLSAPNSFPWCARLLSGVPGWPCFCLGSVLLRLSSPELCLEFGLRDGAGGGMGGCV